MTTVHNHTISTQYLKVHPDQPEPELIAIAAEIIHRGGLVGFPTETVYGLGANAWDQAAVARIFQAKGRPGDNPLIVHVAEPAMVRTLVSELPPLAEQLITQFWPGPLTLVLPRSAQVPDEVTAGLETVAVRMPAHPVALALISAAQVPIAAPSANRSGRPSPTTAEHVLADLGGKIEAILDGGPTGIGVESTVLDLTAGVPTILRPGGVTREELAAVLGQVAIDPHVEGKGVLSAGGGLLAAPRSPGMKYTHYAPNAPLILVEGEESRVVEHILTLRARYRQSGKRVAVLARAETAGYYRQHYPPEFLAVLGGRDELAVVAARLYRTLRACDEAGVDVILAEGFPTQGLGAAVMNRLRRAAGQNIVLV